MTPSSLRSLSHSSTLRHASLGSSASSPSSASDIAESRASLSPLRRFSAHRRMAPGVVGLSRLTRLNRTAARLPSADSVTPPTPSLTERWWNPHLVDRLQTPLSRIRE